MLNLKHALEFSASRGVIILMILPFLIPFVKWHTLTVPVVLLMYFTSVLLSAAELFRNKAVRHLDITESAPLMNLSPIFLLIIAYFLLNERISLLQLTGIFFSLIGLYVIELDPKSKSLFSPLKNLLSSVHIHHMIFALVILSFMQAMDRFILSNILDPLSYLVLLLFFASINLSLLEIYKYGFAELKKDVVENFWTFGLLSILFLFMAIFHLIAVSLQNVSLVIPIKRISSLFIALFGGSFFHEEGIKVKLLGGFITLIGVFLIVI